MSRPVHFGYVIRYDGLPDLHIQVLVAASLEGLEAQASCLGLRLHRADYISTYDDLEDYDLECISELEYQRAQQQKEVKA